MIAVVAVILITMHGPGHQQIEINPDAISSMRRPQRKNEAYLREGTNCVISMNNGTLISVVENCAEIAAEIGRAEDRRTPP